MHIHCHLHYIHRSCILHRDCNTRAQWYDILLSVGPAKNPTIRLATLGVKMPWSSGSLAAFSGKLVRHTVDGEDHERVCYAYTMKDTVRNAMNVRAAQWSEVGMKRGGDERGNEDIYA